MLYLAAADPRSLDVKKSCFGVNTQGCPQDVKSQDRDETETVYLQDRNETETFQIHIETAVSQFKNTNW